MLLPFLSPYAALGSIELSVRNGPSERKNLLCCWSIPSFHQPPAVRRFLSLSLPLRVLNLTLYLSSGLVDCSTSVSFLLHARWHARSNIIFSLIILWAALADPF